MLYYKQAQIMPKDSNRLTLKDIYRPRENPVNVRIPKGLWETFVRQCVETSGGLVSEYIRGLVLVHAVSRNAPLPVKYSAPQWGSGNLAKLFTAMSDVAPNDTILLGKPSNEGQVLDSGTETGVHLSERVNLNPAADTSVQSAIPIPAKKGQDAKGKPRPKGRNVQAKRK